MQTISVKVTPRAKENRILGFKDDVLRVKITAPPVAGKANIALIKFLAKEFGIAKSDIHIIRGELSREKVLQIPDGIATLQNRLI
ncbi:MAG: YggU family protein [Parcubacteria group bacterium CG_4_9_14_0_2_um_filter_41_8]|nr:MAG: YggU family protein [Parcubacteria group bacterium CG1_02_41_12]PIP67209.1 MAG: YggU family protein [Parcubacteria group bacterium CG22_combo_CG10-13_8_21_14_all_41_9]PIQ80164.1 MAG: YggU family protein [Parcubacteria group bacterium CG11_big_fil_rev_8_21_14_0_20_41_14]PIR57142.1 MAG: YggU family protein [Parcubacteria group bacterium CG10_big_fil_rev_8_21_14_0_10_41_35]PJC40417.1 MAG: YggU family protein [Parcubacteria group bacterium CG_4_9_14_0_2_um_filter_41_8]